MYIHLLAKPRGIQDLKGEMHENLYKNTKKEIKPKKT